MKAFEITVEDQPVRAALKAVADRFSNMRPVLSAVGEGIVERTKHRFDTSTGPDGAKWKPNTPATSKAKGGKPPLIDGGSLRRQINNLATDDSLTVQASMAYAAIQQFGGTINKAASTKTIRHRTNAKGELLRSDIMNGAGLIFAKKSHKRVLERQVEVGAHKITIPARPFLPIYPDGSLYPQEQADILAALNEYLMDGL